MGSAVRLRVLNPESMQTSDLQLLLLLLLFAAHLNVNLCVFSPICASPWGRPSVSSPPPPHHLLLQAPSSPQQLLSWQSCGSGSGAGLSRCTILCPPPPTHPSPLNAGDAFRSRRAERITFTVYVQNRPHLLLSGVTVSPAAPGGPGCFFFLNSHLHETVGKVGVSWREMLLFGCF